MSLWVLLTGAGIRGLNSAEDLAQHMLKLPSGGISACELLPDGTQALPFRIVAAGASCCSSYSLVCEPQV